MRSGPHRLEAEMCLGRCGCAGFPTRLVLPSLFHFSSSRPHPFPRFPTSSRFHQLSSPLTTATAPADKPRRLLWRQNSERAYVVSVSTECRINEGLAFAGHAHHDLRPSLLIAQITKISQRKGIWNYGELREDRESWRRYVTSATRR